MQGDRAEQRAPDTAATTTADDQQGGVRARPDEVFGGRARHHALVHLHPGKTDRGADLRDLRQPGPVAERSASTLPASSNKGSAQ